MEIKIDRKTFAIAIISGIWILVALSIFLVIITKGLFIFVLAALLMLGLIGFLLVVISKAIYESITDKYRY